MYKPAHIATAQPDREPGNRKAGPVSAAPDLTSAALLDLVRLLARQAAREHMNRSLEHPAATGQEQESLS